MEGTDLYERSLNANGMETDLFRWFLGVISAVILALVGVVWSMRKGELDRRDNNIMQEIRRMDGEIKALRKEKHDAIEAISVISGRCTLLEDDVRSVHSQRHIAEQLRDEIRRMKGVD